MYPLASLSHYESLSTNKWGIREFSEEEIAHLKSTRELDVIIVPGLAFDAQGRRIGHGRGYYDRFIAECEREAKEMRRQSPLTGASIAFLHF
jgi:5-formyltetrahydrofolate cyclo-ligase